MERLLSFRWARLPAQHNPTHGRPFAGNRERQRTRRSSGAATYVVEQFPALRAIGLDTVSLACMQHLEDGLEAHRILLRGEGRRFLIIEDMNLDRDLSRLQQVMAVPLFIEGADSSPCTVMGLIAPEGPTVPTASTAWGSGIHVKIQDSPH